MLSRNKLKLIRSLDNKKGRQKAGLFIAEGPKVVGDLQKAGFQAEMVIDDADEVAQVSLLQHPQGIVGVFRIPEYSDNEQGPSPDNLTLALDGVQDPGNVGTIIRIADWFGIEDIYCSLETADCWNPKVVQATMGSIARVRVHYVGLGEFISKAAEKVPVYGTFLDGNDIYKAELSRGGLIVMGNEGSGIEPDIRRLITRKLLIPSYPTERSTADSLNVAVATAITCAEFRRRNYGTDI